MHNSPVHIMCNTIKNDISSAAEDETCVIFMATQRACPIRLALIKIGHLQPPTGKPLYTDNSTSKVILTSAMYQKLSKAFDVCFYWVKDILQQNQFDLVWRKCITNMADYFTKHYPPWNHKQLHYKYLHKTLSKKLAQSAFSV